MPKPGSEGHGKSGHLSDRLRRKAPRRYFTFIPVDTVFIGAEANELYDFFMAIKTVLWSDGRKQSFFIDRQGHLFKNDIF